jgi:ankyrin repeat protein
MGHPSKIKPRHLSTALRQASFAVPILFMTFHSCGTLARSIVGRDALGAAAYYGRCMEVRFWLAVGADPNRVGWEGHFTPLAEAVRGGQMGAARILLQHGADLNTPNDGGFGNSAYAVQGMYGADPGSQAEVVRMIRDFQTTHQHE